MSLKNALAPVCNFVLFKNVSMTVIKKKFDKLNIIFIFSLNSDAALCCEVKHDDKLTDEDGVYIQVPVAT